MSPEAKVTVPAVRKLKGKKNVVAVTAYDTPTAISAEKAGVDIVLVGDSLGMVVLGHENTLSVTLEEMLHHVKAVKRGLKRPLLVADMPYMTFHVTPEDTVRHAGRLVKEGGAEAVKIEGGRKRKNHIQALLDAEIPVMGHLGLTPQSIHAYGGYRVQGKEPDAAEALVDEAMILQETGVFSIVLEGVPDSLATKITDRLTVPTIGIGAGAGCNGQVLVMHDLLGWNHAPLPKFVRPYADLTSTIHEALTRFREDVEENRYPGPGESYGG